MNCGRGEKLPALKAGGLYKTNCVDTFGFVEASPSLAFRDGEGTFPFSEKDDDQTRRAAALIPRGRQKRAIFLDAIPLHEVGLSNWPAPGFGLKGEQPRWQRSR